MPAKINSDVSLEFRQAIKEDERVRKRVFSCPTRKFVTFVANHRFGT